MLSYRHAFHAGNFADVLKHAVLIHTIDYMTEKEKSIRIIDTHAGAGGYALTGQQPLKNREFDTGIGSLWQATDLPPFLARYREVIASFNTSGQLSSYPGSPLIAQKLSREQDRLFLHELHSTDHRLLNQAIGHDRRVKIAEEDGFTGMRALLPPPERRALVLIDPSYEIKSDYNLVVEQLKEAYKRFATGTYALWYPVVSRTRVEALERGLIKSGIKNIQLFESGIEPDNAEFGMNAAGMIVINPPWTLWQAMEQTLPYLTERLGKGQGQYRQVQLVAEK